jgi:hypothetical protein
MFTASFPIIHNLEVSKVSYDGLKDKQVAVHPYTEALVSNKKK